MSAPINQKQLLNEVIGLLDDLKLPYERQDGLFLVVCEDGTMSISVSKARPVTEEVRNDYGYPRSKR